MFEVQRMYKKLQVIFALKSAQTTNHMLFRLILMLLSVFLCSGTVRRHSFVFRRSRRWCHEAWTAIERGRLLQRSPVSGSGISSIESQHQNQVRPVLKFVNCFLPRGS